ncbi:Ankyrin repeat-containing domain protein [Metarhizium robertsii ARSEF 23]|uniref:Ankyrin repeat-containing domain protein n=1 Tax=Metarhizium robertsii (strain ARSEF 23 / ATCC MYA-3075) TaxID=655844 RepID=E9FC00_METRA|nr:Ankyrin repeat-containing domain protein [Metarhizium robertsii ARSEF 23]EFY94771.2 Ankyrin repeat-containing domain protein [Metarhizium robertsii ARSEF 23]
MSTPEDATLTENADSVTPRLVPSENGSVAEKEGKWTAALHALSDEERQLFQNLDAEKPALGILQYVLAATLKKKEDCLRKRRKVRIPGREIVIRDVLDKLSAWVTKFISIGDIIVQYDPVHAALPWAAVRFVLQVAVNDFETLDLALSSIERLVNYITISSIFEVQYLQPKHHHLDVYPQLFEAVETLHTNVLKFLGYLLRYFGSSTIARHLKSIVVSKKDIEAKFQPIEKSWRRVDEPSRLATAEKNEEECAWKDQAHGCSAAKLSWTGVPGSGKTKLTSLVVDELVQTNKVAYFYCIPSPAEPHRGQCDKIVASIVRQLASLRPDQPILGPVVEQYREAIDGFSEFEDQAWSIEESDRVVLELLGEYPAVTIILDALDEVNYEERQTLMDVLSRWIQKFRWVELQIQSLVPLKVAADNRNRLGKLPPTLEGSYWEIYNTILESGKHASKLAIFTFQWLLYGQKVITAHNFAAIASASLQIQEPNGEKRRSDSLEAITTGEILDVCANLVVLRNGVFVLANLSVREFLEGLTARSVDTMIAARGNAAIAAACLQLFLTRTEAAYDELQESAVADSPRDTRNTQSPIEEVMDSPTGTKGPQSDDAAESTTAEPALKKDGNDSIDDSSTPGADDYQSKATVKAQPPEPKPIHVKIATHMINSDDSHASTYSCVYWAQHVQALKELRTKHALTVLLTEFLVNAKDSKKVTISFQAWHALATVSNNPDDFPVESKFHDAVQDKPSPIWVACLYRWYELVEQISQFNRYDGINQARSIQSIEAPEEWDITQGDMTPLIYAAVSRDMKLTTLILDNIGMEIQLGESSIETNPLIGAAASGDGEMVSMLLERGHGGLEIEADSLRAAAGMGRPETMNLLLEHNGDLIQEAGYRALKLACARGQREAAAMLVEAGASTGRRVNLVASATYYSHYDVLKYLLDRQIGLSGIARLLSLAVSHGDDEGAAILRTHGAIRESVAVIRAIKAGTPRSAIRLIEAGFDVQRHHFLERDTPLHVAAQRGHTGLLSALIKAGAGLLLDAEADTLIEDRTGHVPLDIAEQSADESVEDLIRSKMEELLRELQDWDKARAQTMTADNEPKDKELDETRSDGMK